MEKTFETDFESLLKHLPLRIRQEFALLPAGEQRNIAEIRLRLGQAPAVTLRTGAVKVKQWGKSQKVSANEIAEAMRLLTGSSVYALENDLKNGFITVPGGHRVGIGGTAVVRNGKIKTQKDITALNYRVAREVIGIGNQLLPYLYRQDKILSTLIYSPPGAGKTTLLRDLIRLLAEGSRYGTPRNVVVIDERRELAGNMPGQACFRLGAFTDVLAGFPKAEGISLAVRSLAPDVIAADEIGTEADLTAASVAVASGVALLMTVHGGSRDELRERPFLRQYLERGLFTQIIGLGKEPQPGTVLNIFRKNPEGSGFYDALAMSCGDFSGGRGSRQAVGE